MKHTFKHKYGFTLVELLIVIVIISILFVVLISKVDFSSNEARTTGVQTDLRAYAAATSSAALEHYGLSEDTTELSIMLNKYLDPELQINSLASSLKTGKTDPWGKEYLVMFGMPEGSMGEMTYVCAGPDM